MTDVITAVLQLPVPIAAAVTLEAGEIITAQIVQPAAPIAAAITVAGPAGPAGPTGATGPAGPTGPAGTGGSGAVASVFGRTGTVTAQSGDYTAAQVGADTAAARDTAITTAVAPLATSSALTTGLAGKQPLDSDLTTIAALDSAQAGVVASDGAGWIRKTYSQLKTALSITAADVGADTSAARDTAISTAINNLVNSAPGTLDTLGEIATALQADESTASALATTVAGKQPLDSDLTAIAALDASTAGAIASDGAGWVKKTYAQFKTALGLVKADVGLGNVDNTADSAKTFTESQVTGLVADLAAKVPTTRTVAGHALSADVTLAEGDITNLTTDLAAKAPVSTTTIDLVDRTNNTTETVPAGMTTNCSTAGVTKTAPALDSPVGTPPKRFSVKNLAASTITVAYPDHAGVAQSLVVLPAETRTFRQKTTSGWGVESGAIAVATLDARFQPLDANLTGLADPTSSAGTLVSDGSTWLRKTAAQFKTWLGLVAADIPTIAESQVTNLTTDLAAASKLNTAYGPGTMETGAVAETMSRKAISNSGLTKPSGTFRGVLVDLPAGLVITSISVWISGTALAGGTHSWGAVLDSTGKVLAVSNDDTTATQSATTKRTFTLTSPLTIPSHGGYYLGNCFVATTMPTYYGLTLTAVPTASTPFVCGSVGSQTTPPAVNAVLTLGQNTSMEYGFAS